MRCDERGILHTAHWCMRTTAIPRDLIRIAHIVEDMGAEGAARSGARDVDLKCGMLCGRCMGAIKRGGHAVIKYGVDCCG